MWFLSSLALAAPQTVEVDYTVRFDLDAMGDQLCPMSKVCDCTATYRGAGKQVQADGTRVTFQGTWALAEHDCNDALLVWRPSDGAAFHTFHLQGGKVVDWVTHAAAGSHAKRASEMAANGQFWIDELNTPWPTPRVQNTQRDSGPMVMGITLSATHQLNARFSGG